MEEVIIETSIPIESEHLEKILAGYSLIDQGTAPLYSDIVEKLMLRGLDKMSYERIVEVAKSLSKATNVHKGGYGWYEAMEKHIHMALHENKLTDFAELSKIAENMLSNNIGSTAFQE
jgi:hypothetical protein